MGWELERRGVRAVVREDGRIECQDGELLAALRRWMSEPVTVYRRGTVTALDTDQGDPLELIPGDRRYVVARVRSLPGCDPDLRIVGMVFE